MNNKIYNLCDEKGNCSNCGECCTDILPLSPSELARIRDYVKKHNIKEQRHLTEKIDLTCPFRSESGKGCLIHPARPLICRNFLCSKPISEIEQERNSISSDGRKPYSLRKEIYNNIESIVYLGGILK